MSLLTTPLVTLDSVFVKLRRDTGFSVGEDVDEADVIEWSAEALEFIGAVTQYEEAVCFLIIDNHTCQVPKGLKHIIQIARNTCYSNGFQESAAVPQDVITSLGSPLSQNFSAPSGFLTSGSLPIVTPDYSSNPLIPQDPGPAIPVALDCNGVPINDYELAYYRPFFDLQYEYSPWTTSQLYANCFTPVKLTDHSFFNSLVCQEDNCDSIYQASQDEYNVYQGKTLRFSFIQGQIAISYRRISIDPETGYPLIPDNVSYIQAAVSFITFKMMERRYFANRQGSEARYEKAEQQWQWYCKQAGNKGLMIEGIDEHQNYVNQRNYLIPQTNSYYGFFGRLSNKENRRFDNPNRSSNFLLRGL